MGAELKDTYWKTTGGYTLRLFDISPATWPRCVDFEYMTFKNIFLQLSLQLSPASYCTHNCSFFA
jgi:hypothetical protein